MNVVFDQSPMPLPDKMVLDGLRFQEAVFHVLANAIKFNKEYGGTVDIILAYLDDHLSVTIADNGEGMTKEQVDNSYEAFGNLKIQSPEEGPVYMTTSGVGLGISTSYKLAKAMNGNLYIESTKGSETEPSGTKVMIKIQSFQVGQDIVQKDNLTL